MASPLIGLECFRDFPAFRAQDSRPDTSVSHLLPKVDVNAEKINLLTLPKHAAALAFIQNEKNTFSRKLLITWKTQGTHKALELLSQTDFSSQPLNKVLRGVSASWNRLKNLHSSMIPHWQITSPADVVAVFSQTRDWTSSPVRCLAWHPHCTKLAVASREDSVLVYAGPAPAPVIIRHSLQKDVSVLAWRPLSSSHLAVGCGQGVAVWTVDPSSLGTRPSASCLNLLPHSSVNCLTWHPQGKLLASGSATDSSLLVWDIESREATVLRKFRGGGYTLLNWSPSGDRLLAATPASVFRIWETRRWTADDWNVLDGHVQAAAWSPNGRLVIFADSAQPTLYCLAVEAVPPLGQPAAPLVKNSSTRIASIVADFTEMQHFDEDVRFGGIVQDVAWDPRGQQLAVMFRFTAFIALFRTRYHPTLNLFPCGVVRGLDTEVPSAIQFQKDCPSGALLTIAWSSGRVQHMPFNFVAHGLDL